MAKEIRATTEGPWESHNEIASPDGGYEEAQAHDTEANRATRQGLSRQTHSPGGA